MKSIEEAAKEYAEIVNGVYFKDFHPNGGEMLGEASINDFRQGAQFVQQWIPIEKETPEIKEKMYQIIGKKKDGSVAVKWICIENDLLRIKHLFTHWRLIDLT